MTQHTLLLQQIEPKDTDALAQLYTRYGNLIYSLALKILNSPSAAEEIVVEVFQQLQLSVKSEQLIKIENWLLMKTRSLALSRLQTQININGSAEKTNLKEDNPFQTQQEAAINALKKLPMEQRQLIELVYFKGLNIIEIAQKTNESHEAIASKIALGINKMRQILHNQDWED